MVWSTILPVPAAISPSSAQFATETLTKDFQLLTELAPTEETITLLTAHSARLAAGARQSRNRCRNRGGLYRDGPQQVGATFVKRLAEVAARHKVPAAHN
jgi:hypothetical protein